MFSLDKFAEIFDQFVVCLLTFLRLLTLDMSTDFSVSTVFSCLLTFLFSLNL